MELIWTRKKLVRLMQAEPEVVEDYINSFSDVVYTWMYYQVGADPEIATDLTCLTLCQGLENIPQFDPNRESLLQWLNQQAAEVRDEGLLRRQMTPQRPWVWSQLPEQILCGLSTLRSELLSDEVVVNPHVQEIVQATLVELEQADRDLMTHRYNHLDIPEHIAEEMNIGVEDVNDRLYRCRHSFRRVFFHLVASSNPGFAESNASGNLEMLDGNLEKLLSSTAAYQPLTDEQRQVMREKIEQASCELANSLSAQNGKNPKKLILSLSVVTVVLTVLIGIIVLTRSESEIEATAGPSGPTATTENTSEDKKPAIPIRDDKLDEEELKRIIQLGQTGNLDALLEVLRTGRFTSQITAAHFVGNLGDESAIGLLEEAEEKWYPNGVDDNPFAEAIMAIEDRLFPEDDSAADEEETKPTVSEPVKEPVSEKPEPVVKKAPGISGTITDFSGSPIPSAQIEVYRSPLLNNNPNPVLIASVGSDAAGKYEIADSINGPVWTLCKVQSDPFMWTRRSVFCESKTAVICNFGGPTALSGQISFRDDFFRQIILSDTLDPMDSGLSIITEVDNEGNYAFIGVSPGAYYLLSDTQENMRLATIEIPANNASTVNFDLDLTGIEVVLDIESTPDDLQIRRSVLMYTPEMDPDLFRIQAIKDVGGTFIFDDVLPGSYYLMTMLENGVWMQQEVDIMFSPGRQSIALNEIPDGDVSFSGQFISPSPVDLFLTDANQQVRIPLTQSGGQYQVEFIRPDVYTLAAMINGFMVEFMDIDLQSQPDVLLDLNPNELLDSVSPLYVTVVDSKGQIVSNAEVWLTGGSETITTQSTGRGAFLAAPAGEYTLYAVQAGGRATEQPVTIGASTLLAAPGPNNVAFIQLK
jgi:DNA-directed RNA polymerase specialized sigma24 family protein